jgi:ATP-dependent Clp protease ATP-binding subunit ClpA
MFEKFSQEARHAVVRAHEEAQRAGSDHIGCEHLLIGLLVEPGTAADALTAAGLNPDQLRAELTAAAPGSPGFLDAEALATLGIDLDAVRRATDAAFGAGALNRARPARRPRLRPAGHLPLTPEIKNSLQLALRAAVSQRQAGISTGHVLIGIIDQGRSTALQALARAGADAGALRADVLRRMTAAA